MRKYSLFIFLILCSLFPAEKVLAQDNIKEIEQYDLRSYTPVKYGLKDLVFEVRIKGLKKLLSEQYNLKNLIDVYYKVYWMFPGQFKVEVFGIPDGFVDLESELQALIKGKLEFVIPTDLSKKLRGYKLTYKKQSPAVVEGVDPTQSRSANRIEVAFEQSGKLSSFKAFSPHNVTTSKIDLSIKSWSHNKWVIDSYTEESKTSNAVMKVENEISYVSQSGVGLPKSISVETTIESIKKEDGKESREQVSKQEGEIIFENFEINTGKAKKAIVN